jgi:hypothetical protein
MFIEQTNMSLLPPNFPVFPLPSSPRSEVKNKWYFTPTPPHILVARREDKFTSLGVLKIVVLQEVSKDFI